MIIVRAEMIMMRLRISKINKMMMVIMMMMMLVMMLMMMMAMMMMMMMMKQTCHHRDIAFVPFSLRLAVSRLQKKKYFYKFTTSMIFHELSST